MSKCQIEKKENKIERVEAPNGEPSVLYESALKLLGNSERALQVWAKAYTPDFCHIMVVGITRLQEMFNTDPNGEPLLEDVLSYMKRQTYFPIL